MAMAFNARGYAYLRLRKLREAIGDFRRALELDPNYQNARRNLEAAQRALDRGR
jgi:tetratricopeptide (TPR) repeat protein